jgi:acyl-CoA synthetase (AMP-forming)/AMP-acid ligase II
MELAAVVEELTRPGATFELKDWRDGERSGKCWKNGPQSLNDIFAATRAHGDQPFLVCGRDAVSYSAFRAACEHMARLLASLGVGKGDVVALSVGHEPEWIVTLFAAARLGAITAPINTASDKDEFALLLRMSRAAVLVCDERTLAKGADALAESTVRHVLVARSQSPSNSSSLPPVLSLEETLGAVSTWSGLSSETDAAASRAAVDPDDPALILFTSGTTGRPKAVLLSHRCCAYSVFHAAYRNTRAALLAGKQPAPPQREALLLALPLFHAAGCRDALLPLMVRGGLVVTMPFWSPARACALIEDNQITILAMIPSIAEQFLRQPGFEQVKASVRQIICGGAPPSAELPRLIAGHGAIPGQNWGMTETGGAVVGHVGPEYLSAPHSCGLPAPVLSLRVVSPSGAVLGPGEVGELQVSGPQVMKGYWGDEALTAEHMADGWLRTGDLATIDASGYCSIVDRAKDMIIMAGENIYCSEIERALLAHPKIGDAAVIGAPHEGVGERPLAIIVVKDGMTPPSEMDVRIFVAGHLAPGKIPASILYRSSALPRNAMGKLEKARLRQEVLAAR